MVYFPTSGDAINAGRAISSQCQGNFCSLNKQRQDGVPVQGAVAGQSRTVSNKSEWFCLVEGALELDGEDNVLSVLMKRPNYSRCADEYEICDGNCGNVRVYFPLVPCWDLCAITPLQFPGCCEPAAGEPYQSFESECDGNWSEGPCEEEEEDEQVCISGEDLLCQMGCSCVRAEYNKQTGRWESDYAPNRYLAIIANDDINGDGTINVTPYYINKSGQTIFYRNADCSPVVFPACRGEGIPESFTATPCPPTVGDGLGCCTLPNCDQAVTTQGDCTAAGGSWEAGVACDAEQLEASLKVVVHRRRNCECCWVAEQETDLTQMVSPTLTNQDTGKSEQNLACLFPGKRIASSPTTQYGFCTTTTCEMEDVWLWIPNDLSITEIDPPDVYIGYKIWTDYDYLGDVRDVYVIEYAMGVSCDVLQSTFSTEFIGFIGEQPPFEIIGFQYDEGLEETVCVKTDICDLLYAMADPVISGTSEPDGEANDYILGLAGDECTVMNLCGRLNLFDTEPPVHTDTVRLFWSDVAPSGEDSACRWSLVCDVMDVAFPPFPTNPGQGAEFLFIENDQCYRSAIQPGTITCAAVAGVMNHFPSYLDYPAQVFGLAPGPGGVPECSTWSVCGLLLSEAYNSIRNGPTVNSLPVTDYIPGYADDPEFPGAIACTYAPLCWHLWNHTEHLPDPTSSVAYIFWSNGGDCYKAPFCEFIKEEFRYHGPITEYPLSDDLTFLIYNEEYGFCERRSLDLCDLIASQIPPLGPPPAENNTWILTKPNGTDCEWRELNIEYLLPCGPDEVIAGDGECIPIEECPEPAPAQTEMA